MNNRVPCYEFLEGLEKAMDVLAEEPIDEKFLDRFAEYLVPGAKIVLEKHYIEITRDGRICIGMRHTHRLEIYRRHVF